MNKNPLEALADRIGMYAYLAAVGGLQYWPTVRQSVIEERSLPSKRAVSLSQKADFESKDSREKVSA
jgi:hypothetical protein